MGVDANTTENRLCTIEWRAFVDVVVDFPISLLGPKIDRENLKVFSRVLRSKTHQRVEELVLCK